MSTTLRELLAGCRRVLTPHSAAPSPRVERLLDSLCAPATSQDLDREDEALAAFHRARLASPTPLRSNEMSPARTGLKAALAAGGVAALLTTGAAFAAGGHAPWSQQTPAASPSHATSHATPTHPSPTLPTHPSRPTDAPSPGGGPNAAAYRGLCQAYAAGNKASHGAALTSPAFAALVAAAGGSDQVTTFCAALPPRGSASDQASEGAQPSHPTHPAKPTQAASPTRPTQAASPTRPAHPTHPASPTHPTSPSHPAPPSHPAKPSSAPTGHGRP